MSNPGQTARWTVPSVAFVAVVSAIATALWLGADATSSLRPLSATLDSGWWRGADQGRYLRSALAWNAGLLTPAEHFYLPGYPLLAALFVHLTPADPFLLPNLVSFVASIWLAGALAARLAPTWPAARAIGAAAALASVLPGPALAIWVIPWTSTPETALTLGILLALLHVLAEPANWRGGLVAGLLLGAVAAVRPSDAAVLLVVVAPTLLWALARHQPGSGRAARLLGATAAGLALTGGLVLALYVAVTGWVLSPYLQLSAAIGFDWRLLPLRWVTIMLSPRPLLPEGYGLMMAFPWLLPGFAGMAACLLRPPAGGARAPHLAVVGALCAHMAVYLCYRDLHPQGVWRFGNYHYFKEVLLISPIYAVLLLRCLWERQWRGPALACTLVALTLPWRAELQPQRVLPAQIAGNVIELPPVELGVLDALVIPVRGTFGAIYSVQHNMYVGTLPAQRWYSSTADFKVMPQPGGLMITPLRPLQGGPIRLEMDQALMLLPGPITLARQSLVFGVPCWLPSPVRPATCG